MSRIEWTDVTWNPLVGCGKVSPGCKHCYAEVMGKRLRAMALADVEAGRDPGRKRAYMDAVDDRGRWAGRVVTIPGALTDPLRWRAPRRVFVNSMSDLFHDDVPDEFIAAVFGVMAATPQHTYQVLTKRAGRLPRWFVEMKRHADKQKTAVGDYVQEFARGAGSPVPARYGITPWPLSNVWVGVSVEDQATADERIQHLLHTPAAVRFVSYEPALGPVDFAPWLPDLPGAHIVDGVDRSSLDWIIAGAESGHGARPADVDWFRAVRDACAAAGTAFFLKQFAVNGRKASLPELDGQRHTAWPQGGVA